LTSVLGRALLSGAIHIENNTFTNIINCPNADASLMIFGVKKIPYDDID
jgi:hypothetical protein